MDEDYYSLSHWGLVPEMTREDKAYIKGYWDGVQQGLYEKEVAPDN